MTTDEPVLELELEKVCDALLDCARPSAEHRRLTAEKERLEALILNPPTTETTMPRPKSTLTEEEKKEKARAYSREWARKKAAASRPGESERHKARRAEAKAEGMCQKCTTREAMPGVSMCGYCSEQAEEYKAARKAARKAAPVTLLADAGGLQINRLRRSIWTLMAQIEDMTTAERESIVQELALLDAAAHAAHSLAAGRLEVA